MYLTVLYSQVQLVQYIWLCHALPVDCILLYCIPDQGTVTFLGIHGQCTALYFTVLSYIPEYCQAWSVYCILLKCIIRHAGVLCFTVHYCTVRHGQCTVLNCTVSFDMVSVLYFTIIVLICQSGITIGQCAVLCCTALSNKAIFLYFPVPDCQIRPVYVPTLL